MHWVSDEKDFSMRGKSKKKRHRDFPNDEKLTTLWTILDDGVKGKRLDGDQKDSVILAIKDRRLELYNERHEGRMSKDKEHSKLDKEFLARMGYKV